MAIVIYAQEKADIEVSYKELSYYGNGTPRNNKYILLANPRQSKFYNPDSEKIDSLTSTPEGEAQFKQAQKMSLQAMMAQGHIIMNNFPRKKVTMYVTKSSSDSICTVYDMILEDHVYYTEPYSELIWEIGDSTKNILGYECVKAEADYHGRRWTVWFTPEIPIQDGPWKFRGLPGLILEAMTGNRGYVADAIQKSDKSIIPVYGREKYDKQDRKEILRAMRAMIDNPNGSLNASGISEVRIISKPSKKSVGNDFLETDYR